MNKIIIASILLSIFSLRAMDHGSKPLTLLAPQSAKTSPSKSQDPEEGRIKDFIMLMHTFIYYGHQKPETIHALKKALEAGIDRNRIVTMINPFKAEKKMDTITIYKLSDLMEPVSVQDVFDQIFMRTRNIKLSLLENKNDELSAIRKSGEAKKLSKKMSISFKKACKILHNDLKNGVFDRVDQVFDVFVEADGTNLADILAQCEKKQSTAHCFQEELPAEVPAQENSETMADKINRFMKTADQSVKDEIARALGQDGAKALFIQQLEAHETRICKLILPWAHYVTGQAQKLEERIKLRMQRDSLSREQVIDDIKTEHEQLQERMISTSNDRLEQLKELLLNEESSEEDDSDGRDAEEDDDLLDSARERSYKEVEGNESDTARVSNSSSQNNFWFNKKAFLVCSGIMAALYLGKKFFYDYDKKEYIK